MLEAKDEAEESGSLAVQTSAIKLCSDLLAGEIGELSCLDSLGALSRGGVSEILQGSHLVGGDDQSVVGSVPQRQR